MAIKRIVDIGFWTDDKVLELFSPEDKLFMLYLLTNPHTTQLGIYKINKKIMAFELGYSLDTINVLLDRFENKYKIIKYCNETSEIAIRNYLKYSIIKGGKPVEDCLTKDISQVKNKNLLGYVFKNVMSLDALNETVKKVIYNTINIYNIIINDNDNDNDKLVDLSYNDTSNDTLSKKEVAYREEFEQLWSKYPNKKGKKDAFKHFKAARNKGVTYETIENGLNNYLDYFSKNPDKLKYAKYGSTWFCGENWDDVYNENDINETNYEKNKRLLDEYFGKDDELD